MALPNSVIVISTADWTPSTWTNNQHMAHQLAQQGFRVLYVESQGLRSPKATARDLKRIGRRLLKGLRLIRRVEPRVWVYSPLVLPLYHRPWVKRLNRFILKHMIRLWAGLLGFKAPLLWIYNPLMHELVGTLGESRVVYHCVDDLATVPGINSALVTPAELALVAKADAVFTTSPSLQQRLAAAAGSRVHYFPNVADYDHFAAAQQPGPLPPDLAAIPAPRIGFIGTLKDYKIDFDLIEQVARQRPEWHWVLVGAFEVADGPALLQRFEGLNLHFLGERPYGDLPAYLRGFDVATLPCLLNQYTRSMFPMKFFEYLAAAKPVVATPLAALAAYQDLYFVVDTPAALIATVEGILAGRLQRDRAAILAAAQEHTWSQRCRKMLALVQAARDP